MATTLLITYALQNNNVSQSVPLALLKKVENAHDEQRNLYGFLLPCKDLRTIAIYFLNPESLGTINSLFKHFLFPQKIGYDPIPFDLKADE